MPAMHAQMKARMDAEGLPYGERTMTYNSRLAQELGQVGGHSRAARRSTTRCSAPTSSTRATSRDPRCSSKSPQRVGLPVDGAREVLEQRTFKAAVDADWELARRYGITGVPTFVAGGDGVVGAQPYETLEELVREVGKQSDA